MGDINIASHRIALLANQHRILIRFNQSYHSR
jgi:hypothetical protein